MPSVDISHLEVKYLQKKKKETVALNDFSASFPDGKISVILGESGCGKSTLLNTIAGYLDYEGLIQVDGVDYSKVGYEKRSLALMNQDFVLYPIYNIYDNIAFPLGKKKYQRAEIDAKVKSIANAFGIQACLTRLPKQISIGQAQRAAIAKALIKDPKLILFDEPLSNLDPLNKEEISQYIKAYAEGHHATILYVTHSIKEALSLGDLIYVMKDGRVVDQGDKDAILVSSNPETQALIHKGYLDDEEAH